MRIYQVFDNGEIVCTTKDAAKALVVLSELLDENGVNSCAVLESTVE